MQYETGAEGASELAGARYGGRSRGITTGPCGRAGHTSDDMRGLEDSVYRVRRASQRSEELHV
jgi:hypothetical protein